MLSPLEKHPGHIFIERFGAVRSVEDVMRYTEFLRYEAGIGDNPAIDLTAIHRHFGIPEPILDSLAGPQGFVVDGEAGLIVLEADDPLVRQRFTNAHELIELLFAAHDALPADEQWSSRFADDEKELLCDQGAAALLMPAASFLRRVETSGVSILAASELAALYETSLLATLLRMVRLGPGLHMLALWRHCLKPAEQRKLPSPLQHTLWGDFDPAPARKWRVWWTACTDSAKEQWHFALPTHKSVPDDSVIARAGNGEGESVLTEPLVMEMPGRKSKVPCLAEAKRITLGIDVCVLSLLHLSGDENCGMERHLQGYNVDRADSTR